MIPSREQVKLAAISVAETTCANPSPAGQIIPREYLWELGQLPTRPDSLSKEDHDAWGFAEPEFFRLWREKVHKTIGRYPITVRGEGFRLPNHEEVAPHMEKEALGRAVNAARKSQRIIKGVPDDELDHDGRLDKYDRLGRLAFVEKTIEHGRMMRFTPDGGIANPISPAPHSVPQPKKAQKFDPSSRYVSNKNNTNNK